MANNPADVYLLSETKLRPSHKLPIENFNVIRTDRGGGRGGGGTAILVKNSIKYETIFHPSSVANTILEYTILKLFAGSEPIFIVAAYANNSDKIQYISELNELFEKLKLYDDSHYYILAGDLNSRHTCWGDSRCNNKGTFLKRWEDTASTRYRARIIPPAKPTFPSSGSYLDLCIVDDRLGTTDLLDNSAQVLDYSSDHRAISITLNLRAELEITGPTKLYRYMYKKTKSKKFHNNLARAYTNSIPPDENLSNREIDNHFATMEKHIQAEIKQTVPKYKPRDNVLNYTIRRADKLHRYKSYLITQINNTYKQPRGSHTWIFLKNLLATLDTKLQTEFNISYTKYWSSQAKRIDPTKTKSFFPEINRMFRPKPQTQIRKIKIDAADAHLATRCGLNPANLPAANDELIIHTLNDTLNVIGAAFERTNSPRSLNQGTRLREMVESCADQMISRLMIDTVQNNTITNFSNTNSALTLFENE